MHRHRQTRESQRGRRQAALAGSGLYLYQNMSDADLILAKPTHAGRLRAGPREKFIGDSYFKNMREVACLLTIKEPGMDTEQKLITEQPPTVTKQGQVEYVVQQPGAAPLNEDKPADQKADVLLTDSAIRVVR